MWLRDTGILSKLKSHTWEANLPPGKRSIPESPKLRHDLTLSVAHLATPLIIQAVGTAVALTAFCVELISAKAQSIRANKLEAKPRHRQVSSDGNSIALIRMT